jgi:prepilin-type processing-associated H-X9-DG protein/prepilin-type N-terminal cleavage/methylation domain-containing protein
VGVGSDVWRSKCNAAARAARRDRGGAQRSAGSSTATARPAFTLTELLVVIGIIVVLIALLLPSLVAVRKSSQSLRCLGNLRRIAEGGVAHAAAHDGYYPLAGHLRLSDAIPALLDDAEEVRYVYYRPPGGPPFVASFQAAIADTLGLKGGLEAYTLQTQEAAEDLMNGYLRLFYCPAHIDEAKEAKYAYVLSVAGGGHILRQSYVVNEGLLGWNDALGRRRGNSRAVDRQGEVFLAADGLASQHAGAASAHPHATLINKTKPGPAVGPITLADALAGNARAGDPENFDPRRHRGRMNVGFLDGHAESVPIDPGALSRVLILP